jgi:hypothetical protein
MKFQETPQTPEIPKLIKLSQEDIAKIKQITTGVDVIPDEVKERASSDIIESLGGNHPLNKIWRNEQGNITGYLAFEDFAPGEAYAKYFATDGTTSENPFSMIPDLVEQAKDLGYKKIHFHGWNTRLNKVLEHFGFIRTHTEKWGQYSADHFELRLVEEKNQELEEKTRDAFEHKYKLHLIKETEQTIKTLKGDQQKLLEQSEQEFTKKLEQEDSFELTDIRKIILKLKLARYIQRHNSIDSNTLFDAIIETPKFLDKYKGGFDRLLELHEQKTLEKIAEMRKRKAEQKGNEGFNPYEALFQTDSGKYYMARLLNMPHLEEESQYMKHCVGTSDSYINKLKKGDIEILSFRNTPQINSQTQKLEVDKPLITIEYNVRTKTIQQIKKYDDEYIKESDPYFQDFIEALKKLKETQHGTGEKRDFKEISNSELGNIKVKDYHLFTEKGEINFKDFDPESNLFVLKMGKMDITKETVKEDAVKIFRIVEGIQLKPEEFAYNASEVNENTKAYIGELYPNIFKELPENIEHIYTEFPEGKAMIKEIQIPEQYKTGGQHEQDLESLGIQRSQWGQDVLKGANLKEGLGKKYKIVIVSNKSLGFPNGAERQQSQNKAKELGIAKELLPANVGIELRKQYLNQPLNEYILVDMEAIPDRDGDPYVFFVSHNSDGLWLLAYYGRADYRDHGDIRWVFLAS